MKGERAANRAVKGEEEQWAISRARQICEARAGLEYFSPWLVIDQPLIDRFADVTEDRQFIHVDPKRAASTPFGGTIAHGFLLLSMLPHLHERANGPDRAQIAMGINAGFDKVRFLAPVKAGEQVRARFAVAEIAVLPTGRVRQGLDVELQLRGKATPALSARWISQLVVRAPDCPDGAG